MTWIQWFCSLEGHEFLVEIDDEFIRDPFNLMGIGQEAKYTKEKLKNCMRMVLSPQQPSEEDLNYDTFLEINQESSDLYGLLHARFINTPRGLAKVYQKFLAGVYGTCPRALCDRQKVLPVGLSDTLRTSRFKIYCPRCEEVYVPKVRQVNVDGAYFGTSFPHVFLKHYPLAVILPPKIYHYEPKIYGFRIAGKRGSMYFNPPAGNVRYVEDSMQGLELEELKNKASAGGKDQRKQVVTDKLLIDFSKKVGISDRDTNASHFNINANVAADLNNLSSKENQLK